MGSTFMQTHFVSVSYKIEYKFHTKLTQNFVCIMQTHLCQFWMKS